MFKALRSVVSPTRSKVHPVTRRQVSLTDVDTDVVDDFLVSVVPSIVVEADKTGLLTPDTSVAGRFTGQITSSEFLHKLHQRLDAVLQGDDVKEWHTTFYNHLLHLVDSTLYTLDDLNADLSTLAHRFLRFCYRRGIKCAVFVVDDVFVENGVEDAQSFSSVWVTLLFLKALTQRVIAPVEGDENHTKVYYTSQDSQTVQVLEIDIVSHGNYTSGKRNFSSVYSRLTQKDATVVTVDDHVHTGSQTVKRMEFCFPEHQQVLLYGVCETTIAHKVIAQDRATVMFGSLRSKKCSLSKYLKHVHGSTDGDYELEFLQQYAPQFLRRYNDDRYVTCMYNLVKTYATFFCQPFTLSWKTWSVYGQDAKLLDDKYDTRTLDNPCPKTTVVYDVDSQRLEDVGLQVCNFSPSPRLLYRDRPEWLSLLEKYNLVTYVQ